MEKFYVTVNANSVVIRERLTFGRSKAAHTAFFFSEKRLHEQLAKQKSFCVTLNAEHESHRGAE